MVTYLLASLDHLNALHRLLATARYSFKNIADEDLRVLLKNGALVLAYEGAALWGALGISLEERPASLPATALNRGSVNIAAFMPGYWPGDWIPQLLDEALHALPANARPLHLASYGPAIWMERGLHNAGFEIEAQIISMALEKVHQFNQPLPTPPDIQLRTATPQDLPELAVMDAQVFEPLWHFGERYLMELLWRGRMQLATSNGRIIGYSSLLNNSKSEAQLARLAVAPAQQRKGIGYLLLIDAVAACRELGYRRLALNTQSDNLRSQSLYARLGFRPFGEKISVLTRNIY